MMNIQQACEAFRVLLEEQQARIANMSAEKTDFTTKKVVTIGVIDGDGIGPIITKEATRVLEKLLAEENADACAAFGINQAPTLIVSDGESFKKYAGVSDIRGYLRSIGA